MADKLKKYKSQDEVPEPLRPFYEERNGEWVPSVDTEDTTALKNAYQRVKDAEKALRQRFGNLPDDITGEQILDLLEKQRTRDEQESLKAGEFDKLKGQLIEQHAKEMAKATGRVKSLEGTIHKLLIDNEVMKVLGDKDVGVKSIELLKPHVASKVRVVEDAEGVFKIQVLDDKGEPRIGDAQGSSFTVRALVDEMRANTNFAPAFSAPASSGSGAGEGKSQSQLPGSGAVRSIKDLRTDADKVAFIRENGREAFEKLLATAGSEAAAQVGVSK